MKSKWLSLKCSAKQLVYNLCYESHAVSHILSSSTFCFGTAPFKVSSRQSSSRESLQQIQKSVLFADIPDTIFQHKFPVTWR